MNDNLKTIMSLFNDIFAKNEDIEKSNKVQLQLESSLKGVYEFLSTLKTRIDSLDKAIKDQEAYSSVIKSEIDINQNKFNALSEKLEEILSKLERRLLPVEETIKALRPSLRKEMEDKMTELKSQLHVNPSVIFEQNEEAMKKMEVMRMDAINAVSKSKNTEDALHLLERKIDSLGIQLKKLDISKSL